MIVSVRTHPNRKVANAADLAADYKARKMDKFRAWDQFIADRSLQPELDASSFYQVYELVTPSPLPLIEKQVEFSPTHHDALTGKNVMAWDENGVIKLVWDFGMSGSYPANLFPADRFVAIDAQKV